MSDDVQELLRSRKYNEALERLLDLYEKKIFRMVATLLRDSGRAEEVTQDVFLKLWRALPSYDGRATLSTWLYAIARNTALSAVRSASYRKTDPLETSHEPAAAALRPIDLALAECVDRLPDVQREVVMLFYFEDRNIAEVANMLDLPEGTVKSHLHRARRALAQMME